MKFIRTWCRHWINISHIIGFGVNDAGEVHVSLIDGQNHLLFIGESYLEASKALDEMIERLNLSVK